MNPINNIRIGFSGPNDDQQVTCVPTLDLLIKTSWLCFIISTLFIIALWNYDYLPEKMKIWLGIGMCLLWLIVGASETYSRFEARIQAKREAMNSLQGHTEVDIYLPQSQAFVAKIELATLERDGLDHAIVRASRSENRPTVPFMSQDEINALRGHQGETSIRREPSSLLGPEKDELICNICFEPVIITQLVRCLPCFHQFHGKCIDEWLNRRGTCPVCKITIAYERPPSLWNGTSGEEMV